MAKAIAEMHSASIQTIQNLEDDEMLLSVYGDEPVVARKPVYWSDPAFAGQFDPNPLQLDVADLVSKPVHLIPDARLSTRDRLRKRREYRDIDLDTELEIPWLDKAIADQRLEVKHRLGEVQDILLRVAKGHGLWTDRFRDVLDLVGETKFTLERGGMSTTVL